MPEETHKTKDAEDYKSMIDDLNTNQLRDIQQCRMETDKLTCQVRMVFNFVPIFNFVLLILKLVHIFM